MFLKCKDNYRIIQSKRLSSSNSYIVSSKIYLPSNSLNHS